MIKQIQEAIDNNSDIEVDLELLDKAKTDREVLNIAYTIKAKRSVRKNMIFSIIKVLKDEEHRA